MNAPPDAARIRTIIPPRIIHKITAKGLAALAIREVIGSNCPCVVSCLSDEASTVTEEGGARRMIGDDEGEGCMPGLWVP
jgi:hypothetical protein